MKFARSFLQRSQGPCPQELIRLRNEETNRTLTFVKHLYALSKSFIDRISVVSYDNLGGQVPLPSHFTD